MPSTAEPATAPETLAFEELLAAFRREIDGDLGAFLAARRRETAAAAPEAVALVDALADLLGRGGKRLRPALVHHAFVATGGGDPAQVRPLALATEVLHTYLLVHDDIMDHAEVRRGRPTSQVLFAERHRARGWRGDAADYGRSMAILVGDLAASYAGELAARLEVAAERRGAVAQCFATMSHEVIHGQYLEVQLGFADAASEEDLERVLRLKSGRYSVERPIELGALAAGAGAAERRALSRYGRALGEAFQLQDDLLGMFGDADTVGKPVGSDLAEGKFTFLVYHALAAADAADGEWLESVRGRGDLGPEEVSRARELMRTTGALARVREMIAARLATAREALASLRLHPAGAAFLAGLIDYSRRRER
jgi:geranylgeranyl diphosphate synthase, type I